MDYSRFDWEETDILKSAEQVADTAKSLAKVGIGGVCVPPFMVKTVADALRGSATHTVAQMGQLGLSKSIVKAIEASSCVKDGADRIEVSVNTSYLARREYDLIRGELLEIARAAKAARSNVILAATSIVIHSGDREKYASIVLQSAFDEIVSHTLFAESDTQLRWELPSGLRLKYRNRDTTPEEMFAAGAHRVGVISLNPNP